MPTLFVKSIFCFNLKKKNITENVKLSPFNGLNQQIKPNQTRWHYSLIAYLTMNAKYVRKYLVKTYTSRNLKMRLLHIVKKRRIFFWLPYHMLFNTFRRLRDKIVKKLRSFKLLLGLLEYYLHLFFWHYKYERNVCFYRLII